MLSTGNYIVNAGKTMPLAACIISKNKRKVMISVVVQVLAFAQND